MPHILAYSMCAFLYFLKMPFAPPRVPRLGEIGPHS